jgi:hypothetical protein
MLKILIHGQLAREENHPQATTLYLRLHEKLMPILINALSKQCQIISLVLSLLVQQHYKLNYNKILFRFIFSIKKTMFNVSSILLFGFIHFSFTVFVSVWCCGSEEFFIILNCFDVLKFKKIYYFNIF